MLKKLLKYRKRTSENSIYRIENDTLFLSNSLTLATVPEFSVRILNDLKSNKSENLIINLEDVKDIDSAGVTTIFWLKKKLGEKDISVRMEGAASHINKKMELFQPEKLSEQNQKADVGFFEGIGDALYQFFVSYLYEFMLLAANVFYFSATDIFKKNKRRKGEFTNQAVLIGVNATLIVTVMSFVIGLVLALQSAEQLRDFGANIYIVDLTVIAMMSQMGPLITAILVAGRSGSAIAAEIATMKVTSELDALQTMGLNPIRFVVVPKLYASLLTVPFLILLSSVAGIVGGATAAYVYLGITPEVFVNRMVDSISNKQLITSFVKSQVYASLIVLTGSFYGFRVLRGAEGVGKATTAAVVVAISLVIVADSLLGLMFF